MGNTLNVKYKFGAWQIFETKTRLIDLNIFLSHLKYGRKTTKRWFSSLSQMVQFDHSNFCETL